MHPVPASKPDSSRRAGRSLLQEAMPVAWLLLLAAVAALTYVFWSRQDHHRQQQQLSADEPKAKPRKVYSAAQVAAHNKADDCWLIIDGKVFDVTAYVGMHPGGEAIHAHAGQDVTKGFHGPQHPVGVFDLVGEYEIGRLAAAGEEGAADSKCRKPNVL